MLPSRGALRSISSGRVSLSTKPVARSTESIGRRFGTSTRIAGKSWNGQGLSATRPRLSEGMAGTMLVGSGVSSHRALSLWSSSPKPAEQAASTAPESSAAAATTTTTTPTVSSPAASIGPVDTPSTPSSSPAEFAPLQETTASSSAADPATTVSYLTQQQGELSSIPENIGFLHQFGLDFGWGPSSMMQWCIEHVYVYTGLPWWATIPATALALRLVLLKPTVKAQATSFKMQQLAKDPQYVKLKEQMTSSMANKDQKTMNEARQAISFIHKREGVNPLASFWNFLQIPFGYGIFMVLNNMAKIPVPSLENGGLLWFSDFSVPDPYFVLPIMGSLGMVAMLKAGNKNVPEQTRAQMKLMMFILTPITTIVTLWLPAVVQWYFLASTAIGYGQAELFRNGTFRKAMGLGPLPQHTPPPTATKNISGAMYYAPSSNQPSPSSNASNTIEATIVEDKNPAQGFMKSIKQTVHTAKGGMGNYLDAAKKEQEAKSSKSWEQKRVEEERQRMKAEMKRRR